MKKLFLLLISVACVAHSHEASAQELNTKYRMITAGCSNPDFKYSPDEKAFIDSVEHIGPYPWTTDTLSFTSPTTGQWTTLFVFEGNLECELNHQFTWKQDEKQNIMFHFLSSEDVPRNPNESDKVSVSCGGREAGTKEIYKFNSSGVGGFYLSLENSESCGEYRFHFQRVR